MKALSTIGVATVLFLATFYFIACYLVPPSPDAAWVKALYDRKIPLLRGEKASRRIVVVGGSDALYQVSAKQIERETGIPTINMGTHAQLGVQAQLDQAFPFIKAGDTVLFIANINNISLRKPTELLADYRRHTAPFAFLQKPVTDWSSYVFTNLTDSAIRQFASARTRRYAVADASKLNDRGDTVAGEVGPGYVFATSMQEINVPEFKPPVAGFVQLAAFQNFIAARGAKLIVNWHGGFGGESLSTPSVERNLQLFAAAARKWNFVVLNTPLETRFTLRELHKQPLHPNSIGRERYTSLLIPRLRAHL